jgi:alkanesulfonate monooxygenase SsuD/methylene tetrahydromethanopterin reductase-like flavin-dependent oxidoreductase (luciferase family)
VQAGTLAALAPGKFVMGIGTSSQAAVEQWNGIPFSKPYQRSRDMLRFLREALAGGKVTREYETFSVNGFRLDPAPEVRAEGTRRGGPGLRTGRPDLRLPDHRRRHRPLYRQANGSRLPHRAGCMPHSISGSAAATSSRPC